MALTLAAAISGWAQDERRFTLNVGGGSIRRHGKSPDEDDTADGGHQMVASANLESPSKKTT